MKIDIRGHRIELTEALRAHIERGLQFALGQFGAAEQVELVLRRDKTARDGLKQDNGADEKNCIAREHPTTPAE